MYFLLVGVVLIIAQPGCGFSSSTSRGIFFSTTTITTATTATSCSAQRSDLWGGAVAGFCVGAALASGAGTFVAELPPRPAAGLFGAVLRTLEQSYVTKVHVADLTEAALTSMTKSLDPYTEFEGASAAVKLDERLSGEELGSAGLIVSKKKGSSAARVEYAFESPKQDGGGGEGGQQYAFDAGLRAGDLILSIDGSSLTPASEQDEVQRMLRGPPGSSVTIQYSRDAVGETAGTLHELTLRRGLVRVSAVKLGMVVSPGVAYVQLSSFQRGAAEELARALHRLQAQEPLKALILDLRGNPGGLLDSAVGVASLLLPEESYIVSAGGNSLPATAYFSNSPPLLAKDARLILLTNQATASASEIVAGAIQDHDRGVIIGTRTFGKGTVQNIVPLLPSSEQQQQATLKITVAFYSTPSGRSLQKEEASSSGGAVYFLTDNGRQVRSGAGGVEADVVVDEEISPLEDALRAEQAYYDYASLWCRRHKPSELVGAATFVDDGTLADFQRWVLQGDYRLESALRPSLEHLRRALLAAEDANLKSLGEESVQVLAKEISREVARDFATRKEAIRADLTYAIKARFLPEGEMISLQLGTDTAFRAALRLAQDPLHYERLLKK